MRRTVMDGVARQQLVALELRDERALIPIGKYVCDKQTCRREIHLLHYDQPEAQYLITEMVKHEATQQAKHHHDLFDCAARFTEGP